MFTNEKHTYFGIREEVTIFDRKVNAYVYVDKENPDTRKRGAGHSDSTFVRYRQTGE